MLAIEKLLNLEVPIRAQYLRVFFAELTRISNHLLNLGSHVMDVGAMTPNLWLFEIREDTLQFFERASGARMHMAWFRPGGVHQDVPLKLLTDIGDWLDTEIPEAVRGRDPDQPGRRTTASSSSAMSSTSPWCRADEAVARGFTGPMIRGSGIPWDLRKSPAL